MGAVKDELLKANSSLDELLHGTEGDPVFDKQAISVCLQTAFFEIRKAGTAIEAFVKKVKESRLEKVESKAKYASKKDSEFSLKKQSRRNAKDCKRIPLT